MALSQYDSPPLLESKEEIREYLLKLHQDVYGLGDDISGSLSFTDNLIDPPDITGTTNESFTIDTDFTGGDISLIFGNQGSLIYDESESRFNLSDCIKINDDMFICTGSITSDSGAISFSDENLSTTGTLSSGVATIDTTLILATGSITDTTGNIDFDNENISTTGTLTSGAHTLTGDVIMSNNDITGVGDITFTDCSVGTIGGIICENLLDKTATESISGLYTWSANGIHMNDDIPITFGNTSGTPDVLIDYDSGTTSLEIDLTGVANTDFNIKTTTDANALYIDGNGRTSLGNTNSGGFKFSIDTTLRRGIILNQTAISSNSITGFSSNPLIQRSASGAAGQSILGLQFAAQLQPQAAFTENEEIIGADIAVNFNTNIGIQTNTYTKVMGLVSSFALFTGQASDVCNVDDISGFYSRGLIYTEGMGTWTNFKHIEVKDSDAGYITNQYGVFITEQTGGTNNYEIWLDGGGEIFFRDSALHIGSLTDGSLDITTDNRATVNGRDILSMALMGAT